MGQNEPSDTAGRTFTLESNVVLSNTLKIRTIYDKVISFLNDYMHRRVYIFSWKNMNNAVAEGLFSGKKLKVLF